MDRFWLNKAVIDVIKSWVYFDLAYMGGGHKHDT